MVFDDGVANEHERAYNNGLKRGYDLGWSYKGSFDRAIIRENIEELQKGIKELQETSIDHKLINYKISALEEVLDNMLNHPNNREHTTSGGTVTNFW
jgi:hypothetical protein